MKSKTIFRDDVNQILELPKFLKMIHYKDLDIASFL